MFFFFLKAKEKIMKKKKRLLKRWESNEKINISIERGRKDKEDNNLVYLESYKKRWEWKMFGSLFRKSDGTIYQPLRSGRIWYKVNF